MTTLIARQDNMLVRVATGADYAAILAMNEESVHFLSPMDLESLIDFHKEAELLWVVEIDGNVCAFLMAFTQGKNYASVNYQWFDQNYKEFLYIDRVVVDGAHQGLGIGKLLYSCIADYGKALGVPYITAEIDINPPNPGSLAFHDKFGFVEVGRQTIGGGKKVVSLQHKPLAH